MKNVYNNVFLSTLEMFVLFRMQPSLVGFAYMRIEYECNRCMVVELKRRMKTLTLFSLSSFILSVALAFARAR